MYSGKVSGKDSGMDSVKDAGRVFLTRSKSSHLKLPRASKARADE